MASYDKEQSLLFDNTYGNENPDIQDEVLSRETVEIMFGTSDVSQVDPDLLSLAYHYTHDGIVEADKDILDKLYKGFIDFPAIKEAIRKTHVTGYKTLYDIQKANIGIRRINIPIKDFKFYNNGNKSKYDKIPVKKYVCHTDINLIKSDKEYLLYSNRKEYSKGLSLMEIAENKDIFRFNILPMVDNKLIWDIRVIPKTDGTDILFSVDDVLNVNKDYNEGFFNSEYDALCRNDKQMHIIVIPNYCIDVVKGPASKYTIKDPTSLSETLMVPHHAFKNFNMLDPGSTLFFVNTNPTNTYAVNMLQYEMDNNSVSFVNFFPNGNSKYKNMVIVAIKLSNLDDIRVIDLSNSTDGWFMLNNYELPLPKENIIAINLDTDGDGRGYFRIDNNVTVDIYYPNFYHANNITNKNVRLLMFYADKRYDSSYDNYIKTFYTHYAQLLEMHKTESLPEIAKTYEPVNVPMVTNSVYDEFSAYFPYRKNQFITKFFESYVNKNPKLFLNYLYLKLLASNKYTIRASSMKLSDRIRINTFREVSDVGIPVEFDKPMYVINIRRNFVGIKSADFKVFVDGIALTTNELFITANKDFFLFYIDKNILKESSIIEIEKYNKCFKRLNNYEDIISSEDINYDIQQSEYHGIHTLFPDIETFPIKVNLCQYGIKHLDIYNVTLLSQGRIIGNRDIRAFVYDDIVEQFVEIDMNGHYIISGDVYFCFTKDYCGNKVSIIYDTSVTYHTVKVSDEFVLDTTFTTTRRTRPNDIRIFKDGLLMLGNTFNTDIFTDSNTNVNIYTTFEESRPGLFSFEAYPIEFKTEFNLATVENEYGYIDTGNSLSYPLDLRWYDIFLNGKKLHKDNIEIISSNKFFIKNVDSLKNLFIIKREGVDDPFSVNHDVDSMNIYLNESEELLRLFFEDKEIIQDTSEDIIRDTIQDFTHLEFVKDYLEFTHINPNEQQVSIEVISKFPDMVDEYGILKLITSENSDALYVTQINSNIRRDYMKRNQYRYSFTPLYIGNHEDALNGEMMCDPVTGLPAMKTDDGDILTSGLLSRLNTHKDRLNAMLINNNLTAVSIYQIDTNRNTMAINVTPDVNILDDIIDVNLPCKRFMFSMDMDVLEKGTDGVLFPSEYDPVISMIYAEKDGVVTNNITLSRKLSQWNESPVEIDASDLNIKDIRIAMDNNQPEYVKFIIYSMLLAL